MKGRKFKFADEGATLTVPEKHKKLRAVKRPVGKMADMKSKSGKFKPWRLVINFEMEDEDSPGTFVSKFDDPLELRVRFTKKDIKKADEAKKPLRLGYWDGSDWVIFGVKKHKFEQVSDADAASGGELVVQLSQWADPPIGIGI